MSFSVNAVFKTSARFSSLMDSTIRPAVTVSVQQSCELIEGVEKEYCPVLTGRLQASITIDPIEDTGDRITGRVGPHTDYAEYVEFGTSKMAAQPFVRPAYDENKGNVLDIFKGNLAEALS